MAQGVTSSITSDISFTSKYQLTANDDTLIIQGATVTLLAPQGEIFTNEGNDTVFIEGATITTKEPNLALYLGSGDDWLSLKNCTLSVNVSMFNGDDVVVVDGSIQTQVTLNKNLTFGEGNDLMELISMLYNAGSVDFGSSGTGTLRFNGGAILGPGSIGSCTNLDVTLAGGTTGTNLALSGEQTGITLNGNFFGTTNDRDVSVSGGTTTLAVISNMRTNVRMRLNQMQLIHVDGAILEFSDHSGYAVTADESIVDLHDIVVKGGMGLTGTNTVWTVSNSDFSNSTNAVNLTGGSLDFRNGGMANYTSTAMILSGTTLTGSKMSLMSNLGSGAMQMTSGGIEITDLRANNNSNSSFVSASASASKSSASNTAVALTSTYGGAICHAGGDMTLTSASFSGNNISALASALQNNYTYDHALANAYGGAIYHSGGGMTLTSASFSGNNAYTSAFGSVRYASGSCFANAYGGAIYHNGGTMTLNRASFLGNNVSASAVHLASYYASASAMANAYGGAIYAGGDMFLTSAAFSGNIASAYASAYFSGYVSSGNPASAYSPAKAYGGAIYHAGGDMTLTGASFSGNIVSTYVSASAYHGDTSRTIYAYASGYAYGGAICKSGGEMTLTSGSFFGNIAYASGLASANADYNNRASAFLNADVSACGGAVYLSGVLANMENTTFSSNGVSAFASADIFSSASYASHIIKSGVTAQSVALGGAIYLEKSTLNYVVTSGAKVANVGNTATSGGWLYAGGSSTINITVENEGVLTIGDSNNQDSIGGTSDSRITKQGAGYILVNSDISGYKGLWTIAAGTLELARISRTIHLDEWTIGTDATLVLSEKNDTINMSMNKKVGIIDMGGGADTINTSGYDLTDGTVLLSDLTLGGGGRISVKLRNRSTTEGSTLRLNDIYLDSEFTGNDYADTILINQESTLNGAIDLKNGNNVISASALAKFSKTLKTGAGNDSLSFTDVSFEDTIELGNGDNSLSATGTAVFSGTLTTGTGTDTLSFAEVSFLESAELGDGDNTLTATGVATLKGVTAGSGADTLSFSAVTFEDALVLGDGDNNLTATGTAKFTKAVTMGSGSDTLSFSDVTFEDGVTLGGGTNTMTVGGILKMQGITAGSGDDTITLNDTSTIGGEIALGGGINSIYVQKALTADRVKITESGQTTIYVYLGTNLTDNTLTVYSEEAAARDSITLNWSLQTDLDKVRILVSKDATFQSYEFSVELYNQSKSFTLNLEQGYFIQFQAQDEDGWKQRLLDDTVAPNQVTGVAFNGSVLTWDETHDNLGGNGVKQYHVEVSDDASFSNLIDSKTVGIEEGTQYISGALPEKTLYFRVSAEDCTGNIGAWSETISGMFDNVPPGRPSGGKSTVNGYSVEFSWSAASDTGSGVSRYEYRVASDNDYEQVILEGTTESCSFSVENLACGNYYWQVRATDAAGNTGDWSLSKTFSTVDTVAPGTPTNLDYGVENGSTLIVIWDAVTDDALGSGLNRYELQLANDEAFGTIVKTLSATTPEATVEDLAKGDYYLRVCAVDNAGNKSGWTAAETFTIDVDTTPPTISDIMASTTAPTNQNVIVTATFTDNVGVASAEYKIGKNGVWTDYKYGVTVTENTTVYFRAVDTSGNATVEVPFVIANIDKTPPVKPIASADITDPTPNPVTVSAEFSEDSVLCEYSMDGTTWQEYMEPITFNTVGTVFFRSADKVGNLSDVTVYTVSNIDTTPPDKPTASADITSATNQDVTVTATFSTDTDKKEYSFDEQTWQIYSNGVTMTKNGTVYFRGIDEAGNISDVTSVVVDNIDKIAPEKPSASANVTTITRTNVLVTAVFSDDSAVREYSMNGETWRVYTKSINFTENGIVYFRGRDEAGNVSDTTAFTVDNIISVPLETPVVSVDITTPTSSTVTVTASFSELSVMKQYSVDGQTWLDYDGPITFTDNGFVVFLCFDESGEVAYTAYAVTNIDKIAPEQPGAYATATAPTNRDVIVKAMFSNDTTIKEYSLDGTDWQAYTDGVVFEENGIIYFRGTDAAGNTSGITTYEVTNIDKVAPNKPTVSASTTSITNKPVTVSAAFSQDSVIREYSLDGETWSDYTESIEFTENGMGYFRGTDEAGNISSVANYAVVVIDMDPPAAPIASADITTPTNGEVNVSAVFSSDSVKKEYSLNQEKWWDYTGPVEFTENGTVYFRGIDEAGNISDVTSYVVSNIEDAPIEKARQFFTGDFNGDGKAMLAVQCGSEVTIYMNGEPWGKGLTFDNGWTLADVGDFNGDGTDDILRVHESGLVMGDISNGDGTFSQQVLNFKNAGWDILGTGDFNGDGTDDVLIANPTAASETVGLLGYWKGGTEWILINGYSPEWTMVSTGDFNGDGKCDMLWKNSFIGAGDLTYNAYCSWIVEDPVDWRMVSVANPDEWNFLCSGDFDGNGSHDIAMINNVGVVGIWGVGDGYLNSWSILSAVTSEWTLAGVADFNGDGTDDIAWSNMDTGLTGFWQINDKELTIWANIANLG